MLPTLRQMPPQRKPAARELCAALGLAAVRPSGLRIAERRGQVLRQWLDGMPIAALASNASAHRAEIEAALRLAVAEALEHRRAA